MPRIFVCEYLTGGGLAGEPLPDALTAAGDAMLRALLVDLLEIPAVTTFTTRDARLAPLGPGVEARVIPPSGSVWERWEECIEAADAVWPIAPETGEVLERLSRLVLDKHRILIGSDPRAVRMTASKYRAARALKSHRIPVPETVYADSKLPASDSGWVVKPDDGAGCEETYYFGAAEEIMRSGKGTQRPIVQPYIPGTPASLCALCYDGSHTLLACNAQRIHLNGRRFVYSGVTVNALAHRGNEFEDLVPRIREAVPGLWGYIGIDFVITASGPVIMEINPRLTEAYIGLRQSLGFNPAARVVDACMRRLPQ